MKLPLNIIALQYMKAYCKHYSDRDLNALLNMFTQDCHIWGTALDEHRVGRIELQAQFERDWQQSEKGVLEIVSTVPVPVDSPFAAGVFIAHMIIQGKTHVFDNLRGTLVLARAENNWKIAHMHASFPDFRSPVGNSFPQSNG